jgi:hypothetical protein
LQQDQRENISSLTLMSKGEKRSLSEAGAESNRSRIISRAELKSRSRESSGAGEESSRSRVVSGAESSPKGIWVLVLPSMPKGEIVGKYCTDNECVLATDNESANGCH